jgi:hypothetical protein
MRLAPSSAAGTNPHERNYFGNHESIRFETLMAAEASGGTARYKGFVDKCMSEYDPRAGQCLI